MKTIIAQTILAVAVVLLPASVLADDSQTPADKFDDSLFVLKVKMAEEVYAAEESSENLSTLLAAYESAVAGSCMPKILATLHYEGPPKEGPCRQFIAKILALHSTNPVALCARDGFSAETCKGAFSEHKFVTFSGSHLRTRRRTDDADQTAKKEELTTLLAKYKETQQPDLREKIEKIFYTLLRAACSDAQVYFEKSSPSCQSGECGIQKEFKDMEWLQEHLQTDSADKNELKLSRFITASSDCNDYVQAALEFDPLFPSALCVKYGSISPPCISGLRRYRSGSQRQKGRVPQPVGRSSGLERF
jgi:hypothetical protein